MNFYKNNLLCLFLFSGFLYSQVTKTVCEDWIVKILSGQENSVKLYILDNIYEIPSKKFFPEVKKLSNSINDNVRLKSLYVLYKVYKDTQAINMITSFLLQKPKFDDTLSPVSKAKLYMKNQLRVEAAKMLGELGDEKVVNVLSKIINDRDDDGNVKDAAYFALALLSQRGVIKPLPEMKEFFYSGLKDINPKVRLQAVKYLGELKYTDAVAPLSLRLKDTDKEVVVAAVRSLGSIGDVSILNDLIQVKTHPNETVRLTLAESLGSIASNISTDTAKIAILNRIKNVLTSLLNDPNGMVRVASAGALLKINDRSGIQILKKGIESDDIDVVIYCIETFGKSGSIEDIKFIEKFLEHQDLKLKTVSSVNILKIYYRQPS
ncbi:MAG: HEAT repeat domain-containing protein [Endomicrobia bacterium]|nr:HEAT repeat domain-containing protein [Endomicrobiia bacterium]